MSQELATEKEEANTAEALPWMRRFLPPHFFTKKVVANRESGFVLAPPVKPPNNSSRFITRKPGTGCATHVGLHMKRDGSFFFKCPCKGMPMPIDRSVLTNALTASHGKEWVSIRVGTESFDLSRADLRDAIQALEN